MKIAWLGDSITVGERTYPGVVGHTQSFAWLVSAMRNAVMANKGVPGDTTTNMLARFDAQVAPEAPDWVVLMCGTNDAYPQTAVPLATFDTNVRAILAKTAAIGAKACLMTPPVTTYGPEIPVIIDYVNRLRDIAADTHTILVDVHEAYADCKAYQPAVFAGLLMDDWHPSVAGHAFIANLLSMSRYQSAMPNAGLAPEGDEMRAFALVSQSAGSYVLQPGAVNAGPAVKLAVGRVKVPFTTPLPNANYAVRPAIEEGGNYFITPLERTTEYCTVLIRAFVSGAPTDADAAFSISVP